MLFSLMIGVRTEAGSDGQLTYWTRFGDLAAIVAAVFGGSILIELLRQWWGPVDTVRAVPAPVKSALSLARRLIAPVLLVFTFLVPVLFYDERYILDLGILVLTYVMLGWGLNVVVGLAGLLDLGYVAFYAVGAYSYALLATNFGLSFWVCLPLAASSPRSGACCSAFPCSAAGAATILAIVTLAFGVGPGRQAVRDAPVGIPWRIVVVGAIPTATRRISASARCCGVASRGCRCRGCGRTAVSISLGLAIAAREPQHRTLHDVQRVVAIAYGRSSRNAERPLSTSAVETCRTLAPGRPASCRVAGSMSASRATDSISRVPEPFIGVDCLPRMRP